MPDNVTVSPTMIRMNRVHRYPPVGKCIYCGSDGAPSGLDEEHIIAKSLGGMLILPDASCLDCAKATSAAEGRIAGELFSAIRRQMKYPTRKPHNRPQGFTVGLDGVDASVLAEGYPGLLISFAFPLPGILAGAAPREEFGGGIALAMLPQFGERLNALGGPPRGRRQVEFRGFGDAESLGRVLAKSAHAYAVAELGMDAFKPFLTDIILGRPPFHLGHYVGSGVGDHPLGNDLHEITFANPLLGDNRYVVVKVQLFANHKMPVHFVVVGERSCGLEAMPPEELHPPDHEARRAVIPPSSPLGHFAVPLAPQVGRSARQV
jgi:hypothetical protein